MSESEMKQTVWFEAKTNNLGILSTYDDGFLRFEVSVLVPQGGDPEAEYLNAVEWVNRQLERKPAPVVAVSAANEDQRPTDW